MSIRILRLLAVAVFLMIVLFSIIPIEASAVSTSAAAAVLMDADSGRILYAHNENAQMLIASTTKIMTALVAIENGCLSDVITVTKEATLAEGTSMYLKEGEQLTLETLLYGLLLSSGNDAALAVAEGVSGSVGEFVALMNEKAAELEMTGTSFANPNGLDADGHYSTALDMARLACAAMENVTLMRIASTRSVTVGGRTMNNHNRLLSTVEGCVGLKTGYTRAAGRTLVSCTERNGQRLVAVTLRDGNDWEDHAELFSYGFSAFPEMTSLSGGETVVLLPVIDGAVSSVAIVAAEALSWPIQDGEELSVKWELPKVLAAPIQQNAVAGQAILLLNGTEVQRTALLCGSSVSAAGLEPGKTQGLLNRLKRQSVY